MAAVKSTIPELEPFIDSPPSSVRIGRSRLPASHDVPGLEIFFWVVLPPDVVRALRHPSALLAKPEGRTMPLGEPVVKDAG
jgi:hypothetical protein